MHWKYIPRENWFINILPPLWKEKLSYVADCNNLSVFSIVEKRGQNLTKNMLLLSVNILGQKTKKCKLSNMYILHLHPSLNTQSCIKGLLGVRASTEKNVGPIMSNFWVRFFHVFGVTFFFLIFWKHYSVCTKKLHNTFFIKKFFGNILTPKTWKN